MSVLTEFEMISDKYKKERAVNYNIVFNNLMSSIIGMFEFKGLPESVKTDMLMRYVFSNGMAAIPLTVEDPPVCICSLSGPVDAYGYGSSVIATTQNGKSYRGKIGEDLALFRNNTYYYPEFYLLKTAKLLTELYTSLKCNIINSRLAPIGKAKNDNQKAALETGFESIYRGKPFVVKNDDIFSEDSTLIEHFTDVHNAAYIPYLSQLEDDIIQKFYYHYGINLKNENKRAQVNTEELQGADALVWTIPLQKLSEMRAGVEMLKTKYPDAAVDFGGVWKMEYDKYLRSTREEEQNNDNKTDEDITDNDGDPVESE